MQKLMSKPKIKDYLDDLVDELYQKNDYYVE